MDVNDDAAYLTPTDYRRKTYMTLREQAEIDVLQDKKLKLLEQAFNCVIDVKSIRPV